jgi:hypothetical protein
MCEAHRKMRYAIDRPQLAAEAVKSGATGDWRSGSASASHAEGHWFDPSIAHTGRGRFQTKEPASFMWLRQERAATGVRRATHCARGARRERRRVPTPATPAPSVAAPRPHSMIMGCCSRGMASSEIKLPTSGVSRADKPAISGMGSVPADHPKRILVA